MSSNSLMNGNFFWSVMDVYASHKFHSNSWDFFPLFLGEVEFWEIKNSYIMEVLYIWRLHRCLENCNNNKTTSVLISWQFDTDFAVPGLELFLNGEQDWWSLKWAIARIRCVLCRAAMFSSFFRTNLCDHFVKLLIVTTCCIKNSTSNALPSLMWHRLSRALRAYCWLHIM